MAKNFNYTLEDGTRFAIEAKDQAEADKKAKANYGWKKPKKKKEE